MKRRRTALRVEWLEPRLVLSNQSISPPCWHATPMPPVPTISAAGSDSYQLGTLLGTRTISEEVEMGNYADAFSFRLDQNALLTVQLDQLEGDVDLYLMDGRGQQMARSIRSGSQAEEISQLLEAGDYFLRVQAYRQTSSSYQLRIGASTRPSDNLLDGAGSSPSSARFVGDLTLPRQFADSVSRQDAADFYQFDLLATATVQLQLSHLSQDIDLYVFDSEEAVVTRSIRSQAANEEIEIRLPPGTYYVGVVPYRAAESLYQLTLRAAAEPNGNLPPSDRPALGPGYGNPVVPSPSSPVPSPPPLPESDPPAFPAVPYYGSSRDWNHNTIQAPEVWAQGLTGQGVTVAVIDTGVDWNHVDLNDDVWRNAGEVANDGRDNDGNGFVDDVYGWNFVDHNNRPLDGNGHGTHVAGVISADRNGFGATGVAYDARIMPVRVLGDAGEGSSIGVANGIRYAVDNGADVINLSLGGRFSSSIYAALQYAESHGVFVVAAAGNSGAAMPGYPGQHSAELTNVISVGAFNSSAALAGFSNRAGGSAVQVDAPGVGIYSTLPNSRYGTKSGTSMAAPHVAGLAAILIGADPALAPADLRELIVSGAQHSVRDPQSAGGIDVARSAALAVYGVG